MNQRGFKTSKSSLFLMELILAILFFSLASAICVQMFVKGHSLSSDSVKLNHAVIYCESMAEMFYSTDGDLDAMAKIMQGNADLDSIELVYENSKDEGGKYTVTGSLISDGNLLTLDIKCVDEGGEMIYSLSPVLYPQNKK